MKAGQSILAENKTTQLQALYERYGAMLLGYLITIVKDRTLAEDYLVSIFKDLHNRMDEVNYNGVNTWVQLQHMAKNKLKVFFNSIPDCGTPEEAVDDGSNRRIGCMTKEQRLVFCELYYKGKTTAQLAIQINRTEEYVRTVLKEAFAIIRKE